jgi:hypothetical protein
MYSNIMKRKCSDIGNTSSMYNPHTHEIIKQQTPQMGFRKIGYRDKVRH